MAIYMQNDTSLWTDKLRFDVAEAKFQEFLVKKAAGGCESRTSSTPCSASATPTSSLVNEIAKAREQIKQSLSGGEVLPTDNEVVARINQLAAENRELRKVTDDLAAMVKKLEARVNSLEGGAPKAAAQVPKKVEKAEDSEDDDDDDDDFDMFGDDDEEAEAAAEKLKAERVAAYNAKKATKKVIIAKSSVLLDVKPWDDETDMKAAEDLVRTIQMDGLHWGASKLVPLAYGIKKLSILCVVEDDKVSIDELSDKICEFEDFVQSVDVAAFNKI